MSRPIPTARANAYVQLSLNSHVTDTEKAELTLHVCDDAVALSSATQVDAAGFKAYQWAYGVDWSDYATREAYLSVPSDNNTPVFADATLTRAVAENSAADVNAGAVIPEATDADSGATLSYSMEGADAASFNFNVSTRQITTKSGVHYDFEAKPSHSVTIKVSDGTDSDTVAVTINVTDQADTGDTSLSPSADDAVVARKSRATYSIQIQGNWNTGVTPGGVPSNSPHFTTFVGGIHNDQVTFLESGGSASAGVEAMAELGTTGTLVSEVNAEKPDADRALTLSAPGIRGNRTHNDIAFTSDHPRITLTSMVAPSPDWFVGVSGRSLLDSSGNWLPSLTVNLYPWDAGTEDGSEFSLSNANTSPKGVIGSIRGRGKFTGEHIARLVFTRTGSVEQAPAAPTGFGATPSDAEVTLNWDVPTVTGITGHEYRQKTDGDYGGWTAISDSAPSGANEDSFTVTGLTNDTAYTFQLRAVNSVGGGVGSAEASATPLQSAGTLVLNVGAIAGDDTINIAEKAAGFAIGGDTGPEGGVTVTVTVGATELTATSADADPATWSVDVPADASYITGTSVDVEVNAAKTGYTSPGAVERPLTVDLVAPTAPTYTAPASLKVGVAITAMSPTGGSDIDEYSATGLPSGLSIDSGTGAIGGAPDSADADTATATVTGTDAAGNTATADIAFPAVEKGDQTLAGFQYSASSVTFGSAAPTVTAPSGVLTTLSYTATPATVCTVDAGTGALRLVGPGSCAVTATAASTDDYNEATANFTVTVQSAGNLVLNVGDIAADDTINIAEKAAGFAIAGDTGSEGGVTVTVTVGATELTATSADADPATWSVSVPAGASYIAGTSVDVEVSASETGFTSPAAVERALAVDLIAPTAPTYTAPASLKVGVAIAAMSPTGGSDIDEYSATGLPSGLTIDAGTGAIGGTPDTADAGTATATVTATDTAGNTATVDIAFPAVEKGDQTLTGFQYSASSVAFGSAAPTVTAPSSVLTTLSYAATPATVCTVDAGTGALRLVGPGSCAVTATAASTDDYNEATATFTVTVQSAGNLVLNVGDIAADDTINIAEKAAGFAIAGDTGSEGGVTVTVTVGATELTATSADADPATWSVSVPAGASYIAGTSVDVEVSASKTGFTSPAAVERPLTVDLIAPTAPAYTAPASLQVGAAITDMSPTGGSDIDEYSATGLPSGLSIDAGTGAIGGTPDSADATTATATVTATDTAGNTATVDIAFPAVEKGDQTLTGFQYSASSVTFGSTAPTVTAPTGVLTTLSYTAPGHGVHGGRRHRRTQAGGSRVVRRHRDGGFHRRLQRGHRDVHRHGAERGQPRAERR